MELILIRHGQPAWNADGLAVVDPPLTELGHLQAKRMAEALRDDHLDELIVSPLQRARQTARPLYAAHRRDEVTVEWLREAQEPPWHGEPYEHVSQQYADQEATQADLRWKGVPGGEPIVDFVERIHTNATTYLAERGIERTADELPVWHISNPGRTIAVVAHAGTNTMLLGLLLGITPTPWDWDRFTLRHASITRLIAKPSCGNYIFKLAELSNSEHLADDERTD